MMPAPQTLPEARRHTCSASAIGGASADSEGLYANAGPRVGLARRGTRFFKTLNYSVLWGGGII